MKQFIKFILCLGLCQSGLSRIEAKNFFKQLTTVATWNPIKATSKLITGANPIIPTNIYDIKPGLFIDNFCVVEEGKFYRSAQLSASALDSYIKEHGIKTVINLRGEHPEEDWWRQEEETTRKNNVCYFNIALAASKLTSKKNIQAILNIFDTAPKPMLVHCRAGVDRTGEVSALWVLDQQHKRRSEALNQLTIWHRHNQFAYPAKRFLIEIWQGRWWLEHEYNPANYPEFETQNEEIA